MTWYLPPPTNFIEFSEPVIFHKLGLLYLALHERTMRFPKMSRYSLGAKIENTLLEIIELVYLTSGKNNASSLLILNKADIKLKILSVHLRLAYKTKCLNDAGFAELSEKSIEIGKMLGGWMKSIKTKSR